MTNLLEFDSGAGFGELLLGFFGFFLGHGFLQGGGSAVNLVLGFLQAEAGQSADNLDDADLAARGCNGQDEYGQTAETEGRPVVGQGFRIPQGQEDEAQAGDVVLFHGCCHNPTGIDPTLEQWQTLAQLSVEKGWLPLFDFAYQGFARGLEEDAEGLRAFAAMHKELIVASSYSKNFGLYNERVGACTLVAADSETVDRAFSQMKAAIRANYSNPPAHGASVVATILSNDALRAIWEQELTDMRQRIQRMRQLFVNTLQEKGANRDFSFIIKQNGMFSFSGLTKEQVLRLREEFGVYAVASGRVNVAGMTPDNMAPLCEAIVAVL